MLIWYGAGVVAAIFVAWIAALIHASGHAPIGLVSLAVGIALGATLARIAAMLRIAGTRRLIIGAIILAILTVFAEHTWLYLDFRRQWQESRAKSAQVALFRPETPWSPVQYFKHELRPQSVALWFVDAAIITASAAGTVYVLKRPPRSTI